jgi:acetyl esterase/lipase
MRRPERSPWLAPCPLSQPRGRRRGLTANRRSSSSVPEAYAARLRAAGVAVTTVRYDGITHDFMMLNPLSGTHATRAAVAQAIAILRGALHGA